MIIRTARKQRFTIIDNRILENDGLSFKAKGLLSYLLSRPDDWQVNDAHLSTIGPDGEAAVRSALKELEVAGYLVRVRSQGERGRFEWTSYLYDEPQKKASPQVDSPRVENPPMESPRDGYPPMENPRVDNRTLINTEVIKTEKQLQPQQPPRSKKANPKERGAVHKCWQQNIPGTMTPIIAEQLDDLIDDFGADSLIRAITVAVNANIRTMRYVKGVLEKEQNGTQPAGNGGSKKNVTVQRVEGEEW